MVIISVIAIIENRVFPGPLILDGQFLELKNLASQSLKKRSFKITINNQHLFFIIFTILYYEHFELWYVAANDNARKINFYF